MAQGKSESRTTIANNKPATTATKTLEQVVVDGRLTADAKELSPGVDTRFF